MLKDNITFLFSIAVIICILYCLYLCAAAVLHGDVGFNTDLARDFLLLEDVQKTHKLPLIGPRSGGIPGIFHGPLWIYINLPAYLLGHGNPVMVGWFWILLIITLGVITYWVAYKLYGHIVGLLSALLTLAISVSSASILFNPFGAVLLSPLFFYFFYKYISEHKYKDVLILLLILGCIIQFQIAFGGPLLLLSALVILYYAIKSKKFSHLSAFFILLIPFSTYILFDIRHHFLEFTSLITYITGHSGHISGFTFSDFLNNRYDVIIHSLVSIPYPSIQMIILIICYFLYIGFSILRKKDVKSFAAIFFYFFIGYWVISLFFRGVIWSYYYWPFLPVTAIMIASGWKILNKYFFIVFFLIVICVTMLYSQAYTYALTASYIGNDSGSWLFNYNLAKAVFAQGDTSFGYYIFTPDQYGYSPRYAMNYVAKSNTQTKVFPYKKQPITYLIISPDGGKDNSISGTWWKMHKVNITSKPNRVISFKNGYKIERYILSDQEIHIPSDPNLIDSLQFR